MTEEQKPTERHFSVKSVNISRGFYEDSTFSATVSVENSWGNEIKIKLPTERVLKLIEHVDDLIVEALAAQFAGMKEDHLAAIEEQKKKALEDKTITSTATSV